MILVVYYLYINTAAMTVITVEDEGRMIKPSVIEFILIWMFEEYLLMNPFEKDL